MKHALPASVLRAALAVAAMLPLATLADPVWQQTDNLTSSLGSFTYSQSGTTGTVTYVSQVATNTGATSQHMGIYLGWAWVSDNAGAATSLLWDNTTQAFQGGGVSLAITSSLGSLSLSGILDDTYTDVTPWTPGGPFQAIQTLSGWTVPFLDLGVIGAGASANYDLTLSFTFSDPTAFNNWQDFYLGGQGVQLVGEVPEPGSLALGGLALLGLVAAGKRRRAG